MVEYGYPASTVVHDASTGPVEYGYPASTVVHDASTAPAPTTPSPATPTIPATPLPDTPAQDPLVGMAEYRRITTDTVTPDDDVEAWLADATTLVAQNCRRTFAFGHYHEILYVYTKGLVYPSATPIAKVDAPEGVSIQGAGIWVGWYFPPAWMPIWTGVVPPQTEVDYWGGYSATTLPLRARRAIARVAWFLSHPAVLDGLPGGSQSVSLAGVSASGQLSSMVASDPDLRRDLAALRRRQPHGWQA